MEDARESARVLSALPVSMVKLHSLYIPKECALYKEYEAGNIQICSKQEYIERLAEFISLLRKDIVVERLFSRIPEKILPFQIGETVGGSLQMSGKHLWKNGSMFRGYAVII